MDLVQAARKRGLKAQMTSGNLESLKTEILGGRPVVVFLNLGLRMAPIGHFVVVTGFDDEKKGFYAHSGKENNKFMPYKSFLKNWAKTEQTAILISPNTEPKS